MKQLWAPWRMSYLRKGTTKNCIFCVKTRQKKDRSNLILYRGKLVFLMMNRYPYSSGHLLISPYQHVDSIEKLDEPTLTELMRVSQQALKALRKVFRPDAYNLGINQGSEAGAGIESHIHFHVVPRWHGDTNFMPVLANARVIPEDLDSSYTKLLPFFQLNRKRKSSTTQTRRPYAAKRKK